MTDEEELDGPMPLHMREAFMSDPEKTLRAAVIATKKGIYERIDRRGDAAGRRPDQDAVRHGAVRVEVVDQDHRFHVA